MSLDYIFGRGSSRLIDREKIEFIYSRKTGRIRHVVGESGNILFTFRSNGSIAPSVLGARKMLFGESEHAQVKLQKRKENFGRPRWTITVLDGISDFVAHGKTVFCRHVVSCDKSLLASEDVAILNESGQLLGVGRTVVPASVVKQFKKGVAVKVREGINSRDGPAAIV